MKFINFDNYIEKNNNEYINKNVFVPQHPSNTVILGATGCSKTNFLFNILTLNPVYEKIFIITKQPEDKYTFLFNKFKNDVKIFYQNDEYDLDKLIDEKNKFVVYSMISLKIIIILMNGLLDLERKIVVIFF